MRGFTEQIVHGEDAKKDFEEYLFYESHFNKIISVDLAAYGGNRKNNSALMQEDILQIYYGHLQYEEYQYRNNLMLIDSGLSRDREEIVKVTKNLKKHDSIQVFLKLLEVQVRPSKDVVVLAPDRALRTLERSEYYKQLEEDEKDWV